MQPTAAKRGEPALASSHLLGPWTPLCSRGYSYPLSGHRLGPTGLRKGASERLLFYCCYCFSA